MTESKQILSPWEEVDIQKNQIRQRMSKVKHKIAILSGKGGVGKSLVTINLAIGLARNNRKGKIAILDADLTGPCIPKMLGLKGRRLNLGPTGIQPTSGPEDVKVVSMDFLLPDENSPIIWRGPLKMSVIRQFLSDIIWGELDILFIDLPPGTGDEPLSVAQLLPEMDGVVIVTIPSEVSQIVIKKAVSFARTIGIPIIGIVENMNGFVCPKCGAKSDIFQSGGGLKISEELNLSQ